MARLSKRNSPRFEFNVGLGIFYVCIILIAVFLLYKKQIYPRELTAILSVVAVGWLYAVYLFAVVSKRKSLEAVALTMVPDLSQKLRRLKDPDFDNWFERFLIDLKAAKNDLLLYKRILFHSEEAVMLVDANCTIISANAMAQTILERKILAGYSFFDIISNEVRDDFKLKFEEAIKLHGEYKGETLASKFSKRSTPISFRILRENDALGVAHYYLIYFSDISKSKSLQQELQYLAEYDPLTQLPNRSLFMTQLVKSCEAENALHKKMVLFIADIDNFKAINDSYGHSVGDAILKVISARLLTLVPERNQVARLSGNEFAILIDSIDSTDSYNFIAKKIVEVFNDEINVGAHVFNVGVGLGLSIFPEDGNNAETLLKNAFSACYHAKHRARNYWLRYVENMNADVTRKHELEHDLRKAINENELTVYYQPIIDVKTGNIMEVEALLRWQHPVHGFISPQDFIPLAEETGLIGPLGQWVLKVACQQTKKWQAIYPLTVSVNISSYQFKTYDIAEVVADVLWETGLDANKLQLELTESLVLENSQKSALSLRVLKTMGVTLAIDDFGTGYASLAYIRNFPIDCVKIDQSFVAGMLKNAEDAALVKTITDMAHHLNLTVIAEGVETEEQLKRLVQEGVDAIQGFYFSRALPADELLVLLQAAANGSKLMKKEISY